MSSHRPQLTRPEPSQGENVRIHRSGTGTVYKSVGESQFYSKFGLTSVSDAEGLAPDGDENHAVKMKHIRRLHEGTTKFPKLEECAHFHYDTVEINAIQMSICEEHEGRFHQSVSSESTYRGSQSSSRRPSEIDETSTETYYNLYVIVNERSWIIRRSYENFRTFDQQLHRCIYDRKYSLLPELPRDYPNKEGMLSTLVVYLKRFSHIAGNNINCGPVLCWLELDNRGNHLIVTEESAINTPAVGAAHVIRRYTAQAPDEISLEVGNMISLIDMPPSDESLWWRGKRGFEVGFFPADCVEVLTEKLPPAVTSKIVQPKPVLRKRGKLISFLRSFFSTRPERSKLKRTGIVKERVFGCDLGEHLLNSGHEVPLVLSCCTEVIEEQGVVDGIYRLSGVASNIQKLRNEFDEDQVPQLRSEEYLQDIHSISSVLKAYFRELPNPLLTYQLYDKFAAAVSTEEGRLVNIYDVVQQLPPPHYRTAEFLFSHLYRIAQEKAKTGMHAKNLAIVWAPNLMRSKELEQNVDTAMLQGVGVQAIVVEFLITNATSIFSDKLPDALSTYDGRRLRPKSLAISTPTKLLSLEEAREQMLSGGANASPKQHYIEVGGGPQSLPADYHTVIELPSKKKSRKDQQGNTGWRSLFSRSKAGSKKEEKMITEGGTDANPAPIPSGSDESLRRRKLRSVRSAEALVGMTENEFTEHSSHTFKPHDDLPANLRETPSRRSLSQEHMKFLEPEYTEEQEEVIHSLDEGFNVRTPTVPRLKDKKFKKSKEKSPLRFSKHQSSDATNEVAYYGSNVKLQGKVMIPPAGPVVSPRKRAKPKGPAPLPPVSSSLTKAECSPDAKKALSFQIQDTSAEKYDITEKFHVADDKYHLPTEEVNQSKRETSLSPGTTEEGDDVFEEFTRVLPLAEARTENSSNEYSPIDCLPPNEYGYQQGNALVCLTEQEAKGFKTTNMNDASSFSSFSTFGKSGSGEQSTGDLNSQSHHIDPNDTRLLSHPEPITDLQQRLISDVDFSTDVDETPYEKEGLGRSVQTEFQETDIDDFVIDSPHNYAHMKVADSGGNEWLKDGDSSTCLTPLPGDVTFSSPANVNTSTHINLNDTEVQYVDPQLTHQMEEQPSYDTAPTVSIPLSLYSPVTAELVVRRPFKDGLGAEQKSVSTSIEPPTKQFAYGPDREVVQTIKCLHVDTRDDDNADIGETCIDSPDDSPFYTSEVSESENHLLQSNIKMTTECTDPQPSAVLVHKPASDSPEADSLLIIGSPKTDSVLTLDSPKTDSVLTLDSPKADSVLITDSPKADSLLIIDSPKTHISSVNENKKTGEAKDSSESENVTGEFQTPLSDELEWHASGAYQQNNAQLQFKMEDTEVARNNANEICAKEDENIFFDANKKIPETIPTAFPENASGATHTADAEYPVLASTVSDNPEKESKQSLPVQRKQSVKDLLFRFEHAKNSSVPITSAPSPPPVAEKPKVIQRKKSNEMGLAFNTYSPPIPLSVKEENLIQNMSTSCPDSSTLADTLQRVSDPKEQMEVQGKVEKSPVIDTSGSVANMKEPNLLQTDNEAKETSSQMQESSNATQVKLTTSPRGLLPQTAPKPSFKAFKEKKVIIQEKTPPTTNNKKFDTDPELPEENQSIGEKLKKFESFSKSDRMSATLPRRFNHHSVTHDKKVSPVGKSADFKRSMSTSESVAHKLTKTDNKPDIVNHPRNFTLGYKSQLPDKPQIDKNVLDQPQASDNLSSFQDCRKLFESSRKLLNPANTSSQAPTPIRTEHVHHPETDTLKNYQKTSSVVSHKNINLQANQSEKIASLEKESMSHQAISKSEKSPSAPHSPVKKKNSTGMHNTSPSSTKVDSVPSSQEKENQKPPVTIKSSYGKDMGIAETERVGSVKDLCRRFKDNK